MRLKLLSLLILLIFAAGCASSGQVVGLAAPEPVRKEVKSYVLSNGINLLVKETKRGAPVSIQVWVPGGSSADPPGKEGITHFVEHMLFAGSQHIPPGKAEQYIEEMGGKLSGHTSRDFSYIAVTVPGSASLGGGWARAEGILFDMVAYPAFNDAQVEEQRKTILLEIAERAREPQTVLEENFFAASYDTHPYKNSITGPPSNVESFTRNDIVDCYRTYVPSNMIVVVAGGIDAQEVKAKVESTFGTLAPARTPTLAPRVERYQVTTKTSEATMPVKIAYAELGWHICSTKNPDIYALEVLGAILGGGKGSRLYMELRERKAIVYGVEALVFPFRDPGILAVQARLEPDNIQQFTDEVLRQVNRLKDEDVPEAELDRAVRTIIASHMINSETAEGQAYALGYWAAVYGGENPGEYIEGIKDVSAAEVRRVAQRYLGEGNYTISSITPEK